jgi:hypothetical protein
MMTIRFLLRAQETRRWKEAEELSGDAYSLKQEEEKIGDYTKF